MLANEWESEKLEEWGVDVPKYLTDETPQEIYDEKEISEPIKTEHQCPKCGYEF